MCFCLFFFSMPLIFTLVATSISQFVTATIKFSCLFLSLAQSTHVRVDIKFNWKKDLVLLLFFLSESLGSQVIYRQKATVLEMQNFSPPYMKRWTYVQMILSEPKFLGCINNQIFLPIVLHYYKINTFIYNAIILKHQKNYETGINLLPSVSQEEGPSLQSAQNYIICS